MVEALVAPWYLHPALDPVAWQRLLHEPNDVALAVINPASGPGPHDDPYYPGVLADGTGTPLIGYVDVGYGGRPVVDVLGEVRQWLARYPVQGVMLDCVPSVREQGHWRLDVIDQVRHAGAARVVVNPGTPPTPELVLRADLTCVAEYEWTFFRGWTPPPWLRELPAERIWMLLYDVPGPEQEDALHRIAHAGAGAGWATSGTLPNPWQVLPRRW